MEHPRSRVSHLPRPVHKATAGIQGGEGKFLFLKLVHYSFLFFVFCFTWSLSSKRVTGCTCDSGVVAVILNKYGAGRMRYRCGGWSSDSSGCEETRVSDAGGGQQSDYNVCEISH